MSFVTHTRLVNPRLGTYYGIVAAGVAALFFLLLILEQLGAPQSVLRLAMLAGPVGIYVAIGALSWTSEPLEYFAGGRRVPAVFSGLILAVTAFGATGVMAVTGVLYVLGFDALCLVIGGVSGFVVMATALAPYLRKFGAFTVPSYLGRRLRSRGVRLTAAAVVAVPVLLVVAAEIRLGATAAGWLIGRPTSLMIPLMVLVVVATVGAGGMRSLTWAGVAQAILLLLALSVPAGIVGVIETNMPVPQLSHGPTLRTLGRNEIDQALPLFLAAPLGVELPGQGLVPLAKRFASAFGGIGSLSFTLMSLSVMAGVAAAPWLLPRVSTVPTVYEARKSVGWATFVFGFVMITLSTVAVIVRDIAMDLATTNKAADAPFWLRRLLEAGWLQIPAGVTRVPLTDTLIERDAVLFVLPVAAGMPAVLGHLALAGGVAVALVAAAASICTLGNVMAEDVVHGTSWDPPSSMIRLLVARLAMVGVGVAGGLIALLTPADPLYLLLWALALSASAIFPVLLLSIWWKRLNGLGAAAGMISGFSAAVLTIIACEAGALGVSSALAAVVGLPAGLVAAMIGTRMAPSPDRHVLELTRDLRIPGGETVFDREMRLLRLRQRQRG
jgi:cation/acetate symporter